MSCHTGATHEHTSYNIKEKKKKKNWWRHENRGFNLVAMKIKIETETGIASFCQDCRKDQDCPSLGNLLK